MTDARHKLRANGVRLRLVVGSIALVVVALMLYVATTAQNGLPGAYPYRIVAELPNAQRLTKTNEVRINGLRVGQVSKVEAVPAREGRSAIVRASLSLDKSVRPLPTDTGTQVLSSSVLGQTYIELTPGKQRRTVPKGGTLGLANARDTVQLTDLFGVFDRATARNIQGNLRELGAGFAGRGGALNASLQSLRPLLPKVTSVARVLSAPPTRLGDFTSSYDAFTTTLAPVSPELSSLIAGGSRTAAALLDAGPALGGTIEALPPAEATLTVALNRLAPSLDRLAKFAVALEPATARLPRTLPEVSGTLRAGVGPMERLPRFSRRLRSTLRVLRKVSRRPATDGAIRKLRDTVRAARPTLETLEPAQVHCNVISILFNSFENALSSLGLGTEGPTLEVIGVTTIGGHGELLQQGKPSSNININYQPVENETECESGNEPADGETQRLASPPGPNGRRHPPTAPPAASRALAEKAGLLSKPEGWRP